MSHELNPGSGPPRNVIQDLFTYDELARLTGLGYSDLITGEVQDPVDQVARLCRLASADSEFGEGGLVRKSLDAAVTVAEEMAEDSADSPVFYNDARVAPYAQIAKTAHRLGQEEAYVRDVLDKGVAVAGKATYQGVAVPKLRATQLELLAEAAYDTKQGADYIKPLVDGIWSARREEDKYRADEKTVDSRVMDLERRLELARIYRLGEDYVSSAIEQTRQSWLVSSAVSAEVLTAKAEELARLAKIASRTRQDSDYIRGILAEGHKVASWGADASAFAHLADLAYATNQPSELIALILTDGFHEVVRREEAENPEVGDTVKSINQLLRGLHGPRTHWGDALQSHFAAHGISLIRETRIAARAKHMLLNALLNDVHLDETFMHDQGIERKPLSYIFKPDSAGRPGVLNPPALSSVPDGYGPQGIRGS